MQSSSIARALAVGMAWLCGCERGEPAPAPSAPPDEVAAPAPPTAPTASGAVVIPPFDPRLPPLELELPPIPGEETPPKSPPRSRRTDRIAAAAAAPVDDPAVEHPPLDVLLRAPHLPRAAPSTVDLGSPAAAAATLPKPPGAIDRLGQSIRLERRSEAIGPAGPRQGALYETEAGLRIPVDQSISLEGGVRVDSREEPGAKEPDRRSTPRLGVEVRF